MIRVHRPDETAVLDKRTQQYLHTRQQESQSWIPGSKRIATAWNAFLRTKARRSVEAALRRISHDKCAYCELVAAKDIEHFYPKSAFPDRTFRWTNLLKGCKNCNHAKREKFPIINGMPVLVDPYSEEPLDFLRWNFLTGATVINPNEPMKTRGIATRDLFNLDQEPLREERRQKLLDVRFLLARVVMEDPVLEDTKQRLRDQLEPSRPWLGIIRQFFRLPGEYAQLVQTARQRLPEIDEWTESWL